MRTDDERLAEIEAGREPEPVLTAPGELARLAVAAMETERGDTVLDDAVAAARQAGHSEESVRAVLDLSRRPPAPLE